VRPQRRWATACAVVLLGLATPAPAGASVDPGSLVILPPQGSLKAPLTVATVGQCQRGTAYTVLVSGPGLVTGSDDIIVGAADLRWLEPNGFPSHEVGLSISLERFFQRAGVDNPRGDYTLTFVCRNRLDVEPLQTFVAEFAVDRRGKYRAGKSASRDLASAIEQAGVEYRAIPGTDDVEVVDPESPETAEEISSEAAASSTVSSATGDVTLRNGLLVGGVVLLGGAGAAWLAMRRRESQGSGG